MDARLAALAASLCLLGTITGCTAQTGLFGTRQKATDTPTVIESDQAREPGEADDVQTASDMEPVHRWIEQVERLDDLRARVSRDEADPGANRSAQTYYEQDPAAGSSSSSGRSPGAPGDPPGPSDGGATPAGNPPGYNIGADPTRLAEASGESEGSGLETPGAGPSSSAPPVLGQVGARATTSIPVETMPRDNGAPEVNAVVGVADPSLTLEEFAEHWLAEPAETSFQAQLDRRLLAVLAGKYEDARRPLELVSDEQQHMAREFVEALIEIRGGHGGDPGGEANRALARVEALAESLVPLSDLRIPTLAVVQAVRGYGRYEAFDPPEFPTGRESEFVVYCELGNFVSRPAADGGYESEFSMRTAVLNRAGEVVLAIDDDHIADQCRNRRRDCFIPRLVRLPATLSPGEYVVKVTVVDKIAGKVAERRTTFRIVARS